MGRLAHAKTDIFREQVAYSESIKDQLAQARALAKGDRARGHQAIADVRAGLGKLVDVETGIIIDLFLSYRAVLAWAEMIVLG